MEDKGYTQDGTVDFRGQPVLASKTGKWKARAFLVAIATGAGGAKPNASTFGGDQFDDFNPHEKGLKVSFFNWWAFSTFLGDLVATLGIVYVQENLGWGLAYGISTLGLVLALLAFYLRTPVYRHKVKKTESPARDLIRVPVLAFRNRKLQLLDDSSQLHEFDMKHYISLRKRQIRHSPIFIGEIYHYLNCCLQQ
ncbi:protein NRT1/ PTR FAMILY 5.2-like [Quillaja saponaria]|uniref:Protein NRT1/ PTR FAMILY 5.2-like n=1 Tax=Quillaja saponaria TaxID=32244 RepID=A0AAD7PLW6_QUISA|nr:protein NRT1/ PTR FAMILY 5.2-like [Quillaja saponaria]